MVAVTRRQVIGGSAGAAVAAAAVVGTRAHWSGAASSAKFPTTGRPYCMAMHLHASFSEGPGSMEAQLDQAVRSGVDVIWWTEHDQRMSAHDYQQAVHFNGMTELENKLTWRWVPSTTGKGQATRTFVNRPVSSGDPGAKSLRLGLTGLATGIAEHRLTGESALSRYRTSLDGQTLELDVFPTKVSATGYVALEIVTSHRPARNGHPEGRYRLSYRIGGGRTAGDRKARGRNGIITLDAPNDRWTTLRLTPADDLAALWPGVDGRDSSMFELSLVAVTTGRTEAVANFDRLRFHRTRNSKNVPLQTQSDLMSGYGTQFPTVKQIQALELSLTTPHLGWYGGTMKLPDQTGKPADATRDEADALASIKLIHEAGGLASYNHPFGTGGGRLSEADQVKATRQKAAELIGNRALGCELLEVGYRLRGGCDLSRHLALWDSCSRNEIFLTGTGVSDDHKGLDWSKELLNFVTWAWSAGDSTDELVAAIRTGRTYFGDPNLFRGQIDLLVDGTARMGAVSVSGAKSRKLRVLVSNLPRGGRVEVVRGVVDRGGPSRPDPVITRTPLAAKAFDGGDHTEVEIDTSTSCFVRIEVFAAGNTQAAFSNPIWLLCDKPAAGLPRDRSV